MRCGTCNKVGGCEHVSKAVEENEVPTRIPEIPESRVYVPGVRTTQVVSTPNGKERVREVIGQRGERGFTGERGPEGRPGKDADISLAVAAGQEAARQEFARLKSELSASIVAELKFAGVIDQNGQAILKEGKPGLSSTVPGPKGEPGDTQAAIDAGKKAARDEFSKLRSELRSEILSELTATGFLDRNGRAVIIPGKDGSNGKDGDLTEVTTFVRNEIAYFKDGLADLVQQALVEAKVIDANGNCIIRGEQGIPGVEGPPGSILAAMNNCKKLIEEKLAEFRQELRNAS